MKDGSARSILSIPCEDGNVVSVVRSSSEPALPDRLAEFLEASAADKKPKLTRGAPSVWLWSIPGRPNGIRQNGRLVEVDDLRVLNVEEESNLDLLPFRTIQCAGVHVWFTSGVVRGQEVATAEFWHGQGRQLGKVDLLALTGYRSASELKRDLLLDDLRWRAWAKWELPKAAAHAMPYELAMRDANGNRYVFNCDTQQGTLKARYLRGLAAREPKELLATDSKVLSEESIWSPNRTFRLRLRHLEGARPDRPRATLLMTVSDSASEVDEVEVWATVRSADALYVSDSGVVVGLNYQERADEDSVELTFWLPEQKFGVKRDLVDLGIFKNIQEARALLDPSQMVIEFSGEKETVTVDGLDLPTRLREDFVFRLKDGSELRAVARGAQPGAVRELTRVHN
ncbi:MAG: hypothetical protein K8H99_13070 [Nitrospirae bacterium]|nr:hypothetical protein [Fimbriimonadaceae bacterium]